MNNGWQPIESAPRDGTVVLIRCSGDRVAAAFWANMPFIGEGWHVAIPCMGGYGNGSDTFLHWPEDQPTHWMSRPEPPKEEP